MKILAHICCAPCFTYPHKRLSEEGHEVTGFFYNPNIHPLTEYRSRLHALQRYSALKPVEVIYKDEYPLEDFIKGQIRTIDEGKNRCEFCYIIRLSETAKVAKELRFDAFTSTLLESRHQPHDLIRSQAEKASKEHDIPFFYEDFRTGWKESIRISKELQLYRQKYCGCIFSEKERYEQK